MFDRLSFNPNGELFEFVRFNVKADKFQLRPYVNNIKGRIALLIHGYLGSPNDLIYLAYFLKNRLAIEVGHAHYDSILFYHYNTLPSIKNIALQLDKDLNNFKNDGLCIDIYAHSMGGLVGRFWIEHLNGGRFVKRLITFGTPHAGVLLNRYEKWVHLLQEKVPLGLSLKDMICIFNEGSIHYSSFLRELNEPISVFADQIDYYTVAGNSLEGFGSFIVRALLKEDQDIDGLIHVSSAHSSYLSSKSSSWDQFCSQRATFSLNHLELLGFGKLVQDDIEGEQQTHGPFSQVQEWAMRWK